VVDIAQVELDRLGTDEEDRGRFPIGGSGAAGHLPLLGGEGGDRAPPVEAFA
jgi:hypothetical protein